MIERLKQLASGQNTLFGATAILVATNLGSNFLGMLRDRFFAQKIPTDLLDTYFAAFRIPDFIFNLLILGTVSAAFIPVFLQYKEKSEREAWEAAEVFVSTSVLVLVGLSILLFFAMPVLVPLLVPEFSLDKQFLTMSIGRIMLLQLVLFGLSYLFSGVLNAMKRFLIYAIAPLIYNGTIILSTIFFADQYGVYALGWGVVAGSFLHMLTQYLTLRGIGFAFRPRINFKHPVIARIIRMMIPRSIALGSLQLMLIVFTAIASALGSGSVAVYNLADNIQTTPTAIFALSFLTALFPTLSEAVAKKQLASFADMAWRGLRYLIVIMVPSAVGLILLRAQIVRLILGSGHFGWEAMIATADTLGWFAVSLLAQGLVVLFSRSYYALHDTRTPTLFNLIGYGTAILLAFCFAPAGGLNMGVPGLALAFSVGSTANALLLYGFIRERVPSFKRFESQLVPLTFQVGLAILVMIGVVQGAKWLAAEFVSLDRFVGVLIQSALAVAAGAGSYWLVLSLFRVPELDTLKRLVLSRLKLAHSSSIIPRANDYPKQH